MSLLAAAVVVMTLTARTDTTVAVSQGTRLKLETFAGDIAVQAWNRNAVRIEASHGRRVEVQIEREGNDLSVSAESRMGAPATVQWSITVPSWMAVEASGVYSDIHVTGTRGEVEVETVQGDVEVNGGSGNVSATSVEGTVTITGSSGKVEASSVNERVIVEGPTGELSAESVNGGVEIRGGSSREIEATTVNGTVQYEGAFVKGGHYEFSTHGGDVYVAVPKEASLDVSVSMYNGEFETTFPVQTSEKRKHDFSFTIGSGGTELDLESFQGRIQLYRPGEKPPGMESGGSAAEREARRALRRATRHDEEKTRTRTTIKPRSKSGGDGLEDPDPNPDPDDSN